MVQRLGNRFFSSQRASGWYEQVIAVSSPYYMCMLRIYHHNDNTRKPRLLNSSSPFPLLSCPSTNIFCTPHPAPSQCVSPRLSTPAVTGCIHPKIPSAARAIGLAFSGNPEPPRYPVKSQLGRIQRNEPATRSIHRPSRAVDVTARCQAFPIPLLFRCLSIRGLHSKFINNSYGAKPLL